MSLDSIGIVPANGSHEVKIDQNYVFRTFPASCQFTLGPYSSENSGALFYVNHSISGSKPTTWNSWPAPTFSANVTAAKLVRATTTSYNLAPSRVSASPTSTSSIPSGRTTNNGMVGLGTGVGASAAVVAISLLALWGFFIVRSKRRGRKTEDSDPHKRHTTTRESFAGGFVRKPERGNDSMRLECDARGSLRELNALPRVLELEDPQNIKELDQF